MKSLTDIVLVWPAVFEAILLAEEIEQELCLFVVD